MTAQTLILSITPEQLGELLQAAGYRVNRTEQGAVVQLLSASQGIGFAVRFGNPAVTEGSFLDFTFSCALRIEGELPEGLVQVWNASRRFARLSRQGDFLVMEMDAIVAAGVSEDHVRGVLELWDRLLQEFVVYLRDYSQHAREQQKDGVDATQEAAVEEV
ncbi:YbjN domain-containing protein [Pseudomonas sp. SAICEU22]|uniref:YbjN domain-containing protein n=1 Tax=Pseudomonas agronomica TaxID=2979328 RepID=A0ABT3F6W8_9PSED|nr:YbjN domain-containing protein [Pseudomonas agronomica]MCW1244849.1 YbjN domain-containing protein [Pseudomonas agronomica]